MAPKIYTSQFPDVPLVNHSLFTHVLYSDAPGSIGSYPASHPAYIDAPTGTTITRGQVKHLALSLAYGIRNYAPCPLNRGDVALVYSPNSLAWPVLLFGLIGAGLRVTLANSGYVARELAFQFTDSRAKVVFTNVGGLAVVREMFVSLGISAAETGRKIIIVGDGLEWASGLPEAKMELEGAFTPWESLFGRGSLLEEEKFEGELAHETVLICYSSGTTGKPKGVETTHRNLTSLLDMVRGVGDINQKSRILAFLPFYHIYSVIKLLYVPFTVGSHIIIMPHFDPVKFCAYIERYKITFAFVVPPVLNAMTRHPAVEKHDLSSLKVLLCAAAPLGVELGKQVHAQLIAKLPPGSEKPEITQGYGLTETSPTIHLLPASLGMRKLGSVGLLMSNLELRLVVDAEGLIDADEGPDSRGEIWVRGPTVMKGYLNNALATREAITPDGWFKTGDIGTRDADGCYYIVDRLKEMIKYKGFQVAPAELESVLLTHPDIADAAVIGVDSAQEATELPRGYIVHVNPSNLKSDHEKTEFTHSIQKWIQNKVARHKLLRGGIVLIDVIPRSASGKVLRRELRDLAKAELGGKDPVDDIFKAKL